MSGKDPDRVCCFCVGAAFVDELVDNSLGADVHEIDEQRWKCGTIIRRTLNFSSLFHSEEVDIDRRTGYSSFQRLS